jgi:hypothetical protein
VSECARRIQARDKATIAELRAEIERLRILHLECFVCKASLCEENQPPHCTDCHIGDDLMCEWEDWLATHTKGVAE